jgi:hypothetical protein
LDRKLLRGRQGWMGANIELDKMQPVSIKHGGGLPSRANLDFRQSAENKILVEAVLGIA